MLKCCALLGRQWRRNAGHSKWANIRHIKGAKDAQRSQLFTRLARQIKIAVQDGGSDNPKLNLKLEQTLEQAKRANMPAATVQNILGSCKQDKSQSKLHLLEIKGPGGCVILCEVYTSHIHQLKMNLASILKKHDSKYGDSGMLHLFTEQGLIEAEAPSTSTKQSPSSLLDCGTEHAIMCNAEDVQLLDDDVLQFSCDKARLKSVVEGLEGFGYKILSASVEYNPHKLQKLNENELKKCESLLEKLEALPEFVRMADNVG